MQGIIENRMNLEKSKFINFFKRVLVISFFFIKGIIYQQDIYFVRNVVFKFYMFCLFFFQQRGYVVVVYIIWKIKILIVNCNSIELKLFYNLLRDIRLNYRYVCNMILLYNIYYC